MAQEGPKFSGRDGASKAGSARCKVCTVAGTPQEMMMDALLGVLIGATAPGLVLSAVIAAGGIWFICGFFEMITPKSAAEKERRRQYAEWHKSFVASANKTMEENSRRIAEERRRGLATVADLAALQQQASAAPPAPAAGPQP